MQPIENQNPQLEYQWLKNWLCTGPRLRRLSPKQKTIKHFHFSIVFIIKCVAFLSQMQTVNMFPLKPCCDSKRFFSFWILKNISHSINWPMIAGSTLNCASCSCWYQWICDERIGGTCVYIVVYKDIIADWSKNWRADRRIGGTCVCIVVVSLSVKS